MDLRSDLQTLLTLDQQKLKPVTEKEARTRAQQMHACTYIECSALTEKNIKTVFDTAVLAAIEFRDQSAAANATTPTTTVPQVTTASHPEQQQKDSESTTKPQRTRHSHSHSNKTWRKLVSGCIGV